MLAGTLTSCAPEAHPAPLPATPPMGWSSWNKFGCAIDESTVRQHADALVATGMARAGYEYVNVDDCWMAPARDAAGRLQADPSRFPSGIEALADYVHARGLKFGLYQSAGRLTCQKLPGSLDHEVSDAQTFADWGVDLLKYDNCSNEGRPAQERYGAMAQALAGTGRQIALVICDWGDSRPWTWARGVGAAAWRTYGDIADTWDSMLAIVDHQVGLESFSGPGGWNDPDSLQVGNGGMTDEQYRAQLSMWAVLNAPLIAGNDLRAMDTATRELLTNPAVLEVNQDWGGQQGRRVLSDGPREVWAKPMSTGDAAVVLLNRGEAAQQISITPTELGLPDATIYAMRDLWTGSLEFGTTVSAQVPGRAAALVLVAPPGT